MITVVTPWFNHPELLEDYMCCFNPAAGFDEEIEMLVVDDGSDPALDFAAIRLETNQGFCRACNAGLEAAEGDKIVFLNNDVTAEDLSWLQRLSAAIEPGVVTGASLRTEGHAKVAGISDPLSYLDGWCIGAMRSDLERLSGWSETFQEPAYFSDNDLCLRARVMGMTLRECRIPIEHKLSTTTLDLYPQKDRLPHPDLTAIMDANYRIYADRARTLLASVMA